MNNSEKLKFSKQKKILQNYEKKVQKVTLEAYIFRERGNKSIDMHKIYMVTPICCDILFSILYSKRSHLDGYIKKVLKNNCGTKSSF